MASARNFSCIGSGTGSIPARGRYRKKILTSLGAWLFFPNIV